MSEIKQLTSLRGIVAFWVLFFHLRAWSDLARTPMPIIDRGYLGVDFFFMLSGFILMKRHGHEFSHNFDLTNYCRFLIKRFGRMFPLHWFVLVGILLVMWFRGEPSYWRTHILSEFALIHRWDVISMPRVALNGPDWSISTEWAANLLFPTFIWSTGTPNKINIRSLASAIFAITALFILYIYHKNLDISESNSIAPLIRCFAEFTLGVLIFRMLFFFQRISSDICIFIILFIISVSIIFHIDICAVLAMIPLIPAIALNSGIFSKNLSRYPFHIVGIVSYSIYLIQLPLIQFIDLNTSGSPIAPWAHWIGIPLLTFCAAIISYSVIENPVSQWFRRILARSS